MQKDISINETINRSLFLQFTFVNIYMMLARAWHEINI